MTMGRAGPKGSGRKPELGSGFAYRRERGSGAAGLRVYCKQGAARGASVRSGGHGGLSTHCLTSGGKQGAQRLGAEP